MEKLLPPAIERAAHILTVSNFQRREIIEYFGVSPDRVTASHLGVAQEFHPRGPAECAQILARHRLRHRRYILAVGTLEPRKNLVLVLDAYARLPQSQREEFPLVVVGMFGWNAESFAPRLRGLMRCDAVRLLGFVDEAELPTIFAGAAVFVYPSLYEGFGLPVIEAMASGVPVVVSNAASLPEVVGDAGTQVEADDAPGLAQAIQSFIEDPDLAQRHSLLGRERARGYTWARCASITGSVLKRVARLDLAVDKQK